MRLKIIGYFESVIIPANEGDLPTLNRNVTLIGFGLKIVDKDAL
jgi:hypothetical protein